MKKNEKEVNKKESGDKNEKEVNKKDSGCIVF